MRGKVESRSPQSKPAMSIFPKSLHASTQSTVFGDRPKTTIAPAQTDLKSEHQHAHQFDHHQIAAILVSFLSHVFAPVAHQQCTSSTPCWAASHTRECSRKNREETTIIVDDEFVLLDRSSEEQDGGPVCREATIESWKAAKKGRKRYEDARRWTDLPYFGCP